MNDTYETALKWHSLGVATIPILAHSKSPALEHWKPFMERLPTPRELRIWFANTGYGLAVITGWADIVVIDWDDHLAYSRWLASLNGAYSLVACTYQVKTRRGVHLYFRCPGVQCWRGPGVDVKAAGGYVLAPPTIHPSGHRYEALGDVGSIQAVQAITDLLPDYQAQPETPVQAITRRDLDPFDDAMRTIEHTGISVEEIKSRVSWSMILPGLLPGRRYYKIKCPVHNESDPSFVIYRDGVAHCYGCGFHGDVIDVWATMNNLTIGEAMADLAERFL